MCEFPFQELVYATRWYYRASGSQWDGVPATLIAIRFLLGPVLLWVTLDCKTQHDMLYACPWFIVGFTAAFISYGIRPLSIVQLMRYN